jgi:archaellum biogenesis protein FlaJ (TadC family)
LLAHLAAAWAGRDALLLPLATLGAPLALATAVYTAFLFAQAKARDLWQSPLLPPQMTAQTFLAGSAAVLPLAIDIAPTAVTLMSWLLFASLVSHLLLLVSEIALPHATAHARLALREMTSGRFRKHFRAGLALSIAALAAPWIAPLGAPIAALTGAVALAGLLLHEHAYVQAGQSVPLA